MVDLKKIKELVRLMVDNNLQEISLRDGAEEVNLKRPGANTAPSTAAQAPGVQAVDQAEPATTGPPAAEKIEAPSEDELGAIRSPMVGTFYATPNPEAPPYVQVGSQVTPDTVVCIVEAMKVFNEIKAEVSGTIEKLVAQNEEAVEYGQELFLVRPSA